MTSSRLFVGLGVALALAACKKTPDPASTPTVATDKKPTGTLADPSKLTETAPAVYRARFTTTQGDFVIEVTREWAPLGADRFYNLVKNGYYNDTAFFRVIDGFMAQFGISGDPAINPIWRAAKIPDDPVTQSNTRGMVTFATSGPNARTTQIFINYGDGHTNLDSMGFAPFGQVVEGMAVVDKLYNGYGEGEPRGQGPNQMLIQVKGNAYLKSDFPKLDYVKTAKLVTGAETVSPPAAPAAPAR
ncbi:MAG: peptidylprolyl isomerase [Myxococcaceae bacterium]